MTQATAAPAFTQSDDALRLLAQLYARRFQGGPPSHPITLARWHACEWVRNVLSQAQDQPDALRRLEDLAQQVEEEHATQEQEALAWQRVVLEARDLVAQVIDAGGNVQTLVAGETDGFRHLCIRCCQQEHAVEHLRFFNHRARRPLLRAEVNNERRSLYTRCQVCWQALAPVKSVLFVPVGTVTHGHTCACRDCNQAGVAWVVHLYAYDPATHAFLLPALAQIAAPSRQQARKRARERCWQNGWYLLCQHTAS